MAEPMLFQTDLKVGDEGLEVLLLQMFLLGRGYSPSIVPDGQYGKQTKLGVVLLQRMGKVEETGSFDVTTRAMVKNSPIQVDFNNIPVSVLAVDTVRTST